MIETEVTVWCDRCECYAPSAPTKAQAVAEARGYGWKIGPGRTTLCPDCRPEPAVPSLAEALLGTESSGRESGRTPFPCLQELLTATIEA